MKRPILLLMIIPYFLTGFPSCNVRPSIGYGKDGSIRVATLGGSIMRKTKGESAELTLPDGARMAWTSGESDETVVPISYLRWKALGPLIKGSADSLVKGTKDPNVIPKDPNVVPKDPNIIPLDPNVIPK